MDFLDNVVKSSNAILKERLNNPFGNKQQQQSSKQDGNNQTPPASAQSSTINEQQPPASEAPISQSDDQTPSIGGENGGSQEKRDSQFAAIAADAEAVTQKAVKGAKNIGSFLFSMANKAGQTVSQTAKQVKQVVENTSILTDFTREQQEFIKEHGGSMQAGQLPWADCQDEAKAADIREQILSLSQDKRNFVRSPPNEAKFQFEPQQCYPIALSLLREDPNLSKMRFELVPKLVSEDTFWRNYFYRVSLLKQMSDRGEDIKRQGWASSRSSSGEGPDEITTVEGEVNQNDDISPSSYSTNKSALDHVGQLEQQQDSNIGVTANISRPAQTEELESSESRKLVAEADDLKSRLKELNIGSLDDGGSQDDNEKWEEELQRDLQEFELVSGDVSALDEEALDKDIMELTKSNKTNIK